MLFHTVITILIFFTRCFTSMRDQLMDAVVIADADRVDQLLGYDPLILSANNPIVVVDLKDEHFGRSAIMVCGLDPQDDTDEVDRNCVKIAKLLHKHNANLSLVDNYGLNAIHLAAVRGHHSMCAYLIQNNVSADLTDSEGRTPLMMAAAHGFSKVMNAILSNSRTPYEQLLRKDKSGMTALHHATAMAINNGSYLPHLIRVMEVLNSTTSQSFIDLALDSNNRTALMYAAINNNMAVGEEILKFGADPRLLDSFGVAVVDMTEREDFKALLLDESVRLTIRDHESWISTRKGKGKPLQRESGGSGGDSSSSSSSSKSKSSSSSSKKKKVKGQNKLVPDL